MKKNIKLKTRAMLVFMRQGTPNGAIGIISFGPSLKEEFTYDVIVYTEAMVQPKLHNIKLPNITNPSFDVEFDDLIIKNLTRDKEKEINNAIDFAILASDFNLFPYDKNTWKKIQTLN